MWIKKVDTFIKLHPNLVQRLLPAQDIRHLIGNVPGIQIDLIFQFKYDLSTYFTIAANLSAKFSNFTLKSYFDLGACHVQAAQQCLQFIFCVPGGNKRWRCEGVPQIVRHMIHWGRKQQQRSPAGVVPIIILFRVYYCSYNCIVIFLLLLENTPSSLIRFHSVLF